jgi:DNA-directed RNA polymerase subunit RPC12/RpoP
MNKEEPYFLTDDYKCSYCGFQFSKPGEFRNSDAFITKDGNSGIICPKCGRKYISK